MRPVVPDVNVLVHAFRTDDADHEACAAWLTDALTTGAVGLADTILSGFVRVATNPRIYSTPAPPAQALVFARTMANAPGAFWLQQGAEAWSRFDDLASSDPGIRGNLVPDAHIAALCLANGATLVTRDRGFARFPGLRTLDPVAS